MVDSQMSRGREVRKERQEKNRGTTAFISIRIIMFSRNSYLFLGSSEASVATAFTLAFLSQLLQQCISSLEQDPANKKLNSVTTKLTNGKTTVDHNTIDKEHEQLKKVRQLKKAIKTRRRRQKRRDMSNSLDSCSASDSDTIELDSGDESDLSEGGVEEIDSEDEESDDVYVESDSEDEGSLDNSSSPTTLFSKQEKNEPMKEALNGNSLTEAGKLLTQQIMRDNLMCKNGVAFGKVTQIDASDVSDVETGRFFSSKTLLSQGVQVLKTGGVGVHFMDGKPNRSRNQFKGN